MKRILAQIKCPGCGQGLTFDIATQTNICEHCNKSILINPGIEIGEEDTVSDCPNCGGRMEFDISSQKAKCAYCDSEFHVLQIDDALKEEIEAITPFSVTKEACQTAFVEWLAQGDFCPNDIYDKTHSIEVIGAYAPMYIFNINYKVDWSASIGYNRIEKYMEMNKDGKLENRTRTVTDWRPHSDSFRGSASKSAIASAFLRNPPWAEFVLACEVMSFGEPLEYDERYLAGFTQMPLSFSKDDAYEAIIKPKLEAHMQYEVDEIKLGDKKRDVHWSAQYSIKNWHLIYWPLWLIKYHYNNSEYAFVANGSKADEVRGSKPNDKSTLAKSRRIFYIAFGLSALTLLLLFAGMPKKEPELFFCALLVSLSLFIVGYSVRNKTLKENSNFKFERQQAVLNNINGFFSKQQPQEWGSPVTDAQLQAAEGLKGEGETQAANSSKAQKKFQWASLKKTPGKLALLLAGGAAILFLLIGVLVSPKKDSVISAAPNSSTPPMTAVDETEGDFYGFMLNDEPVSDIPEGEDFLHVFSDERKNELGAVISFATAMGNFNSEANLSQSEYIDLAILCCAGSKLYKDVGYNNFFVDEAKVKAVLRDLFNAGGIALSSSENFIYKDFGFYGQISEVKQYLAIPTKICRYTGSQGGEYYDLAFDAYEIDSFSTGAKVNWNDKYYGFAELFKLNRNLYISALKVQAEDVNSEEYKAAENAQLLYEKAMDLVLLGEYDEAIPLLVEVLEHDAAHSEAQNLLNECRIKIGEEMAAEGDFEAALKEFQAAEGAEKASSRLTQHLSKRADACFANGDYSEALFFYEWALSYAQEDQEAQAGLNACVATLPWLEALQGSWYVWPFANVAGVSQEQYENQLHLRVLHIYGSSVYYDSIKARSWEWFAEGTLSRQINYIVPVKIGVMGYDYAEDCPIIQYLSGGYSKITHADNGFAIMPPTSGAGDSSGPMLPWQHGDIYAKVPESLQLRAIASAS